MNYYCVNELCHHKHIPSKYAVKMLVQVKNSLHLSTQRHSGSLGLMSEVEKKKESLKALQIMYRVNYSEKKSTFK